MKYIRASLLASVIVSMQLCTIMATPSTPNVYDKFRKNTYSNKGLLSESDELKLAAEYHQQLLQQNKFVTDRRVLDYVNRVGQSVAATSQRPDLQYHFFVIDSDQINAFTTGGGAVYVYTGIIRRLNSEAQLAAVLGHEVGHNVGRHGLKSLKSAQKWQYLALGGYVLGGQGGAQLASLFSSGVILKHSRDSEREADFLGLYEMRDAGYDVEEMNETWKMLESAGKSDPSSIDKIFASHPPASERLVNTETEIQQHLHSYVGQGRVDTPEFDQLKVALGGGRVVNNGRRRSDVSQNEEIYNNRQQSSKGSGNSTTSRRQRDRQTEDSTTATVRRPDESIPPGGDDESSMSFIDEARAVLKRNGVQNAKIIGTARGNVFGDREGLLVVFYDHNKYRAIVAGDGEDYLLLASSDSVGLPLNNFEAIELTEASKNRRPAIVLHADGRQMRWVWNGQGFDYFNVR